MYDKVQGDNRIYWAIRTKNEYKDALLEVQRLMSVNPPVDSSEGRNLETLLVHITEYESKFYSVLPPDPIDAIVFRMEQQGLKQRDLVPFIGSKSRVSEILARKRPLTLAMARELHNGLGIPAHILLNESSVQDLAIDWTRFPIKELARRGWIEVHGRVTQRQSEELMRQFFQPLGPGFAPLALFRKTKTIRTDRNLDEYSLLAWTARVINRANEEYGAVSYRPGNLNKEELSELVKLSVLPDGPLLAREFLQERGVRLIVERHLDGTKLDAAAIFQFAEAPVIGMTLRHDRIDNFWFSLIHELAHLLFHLSDETLSFVDNFDVRYIEDPREIEADNFARDILVPEDAWRSSIAYKIPSPSAAKLLAKELGVHVAIVSGRIRHELNSYHILSNLVGNGEVRQHFPEVNWS